MPHQKFLFIFRHGETDFNAEQRFQGHLDIPLNAIGRKQAQNLVSPLSRQKIEVILSSDLSRAKETAEIIGSALKIEVKTHLGIREAHLGECQGLTREEIEKKVGLNIVKRWKSQLLSDADVSYKGGESGAEVMKRAMETLTSFCVKTPHQRIGIATHGGVIRRIMQSLRPDNSPRVPIPNGIVYPLTYHPSTNIGLAETLSL